MYPTEPAETRNPTPPPPLLVDESATSNATTTTPGIIVPWRHPSTNVPPHPKTRHDFALMEEDDEGTPSPPSFARAVAQVVHNPTNFMEHQQQYKSTHHTPMAFQSSHLMSAPAAATVVQRQTLLHESVTTSTVDAVAATAACTGVADAPDHHLDPSLLNCASAAARSLQIPPSLMAGKIIQTELGLALLLVPNANKPVSASDFVKLSVMLPGTSTAPVVAAAAATGSMPTAFSSSNSSSSAAAVGNFAVSTKCKHWSKAEDDLLQFAVSKETGPPYNWTEISRMYFTNLRRPAQCKNRWKKLNPTTSQEPFSAEEDQIILAGQGTGLSWADIASQLDNRSTESVRHRFVNYIDPTLLKNVAWTAEEEGILHMQQQKLGNKWKQIAVYLPGRSENDVKNHWHNAKIKTNRLIKSLAAKQTRSATLAKLRKSTVTSSSSSSPTIMSPVHSSSAVPMAFKAKTEPSDHFDTSPPLSKVTTPHAV